MCLVAPCYAEAMATTPARIDSDLFEAARASGVLHSRSAAQQLAHWARIGRAFESSPAVDLRAVEAVLAGDLEYDALAGREQDAVRAAWDEKIADRLARLDLARRFRDAGVAWVEADDDGNVVEHGMTRHAAVVRG